jgi:hypothetical protein
VHPEEGRTSQRTRTDPTPGREKIEGDGTSLTSDKNVSWVLPNRNRTKCKPLREISREILQGVNGEVDLTVQKGFVDFAGEKPLPSNLG